MSESNWLTQVVTALVGPSPAALAGEVPLSLLHDWLATSVGPLLVEAVVHDGEDAEHQQAVRELHRRASQGEPIPADEWRGALEPALHQVYRRAYNADQAYATASAAASSFALSRGYDEADAAEYGRTYARINTDANLTAHADANSLAHAQLLSRCFATDDAAAYARTYPAAYIRACIDACATDDESRSRVREVLADGLVRSLGLPAAVGSPTSLERLRP